MLRPNHIDIDLPLLTKGGPAILTDVRDDQEYADEKPTGKRIGTRYEVTILRRKFEKVSVKVPDAAPAITKEDLAAAEELGQSIEVTFEGFVSHFYKERSGDYALTAKAEKIVRKDVKK